jgi:hypothetical protein
MEYLTPILRVDAARRPWLNPSTARARRFMNAARQRAQNRPTLRDVTAGRIPSRSPRRAAAAGNYPAGHGLTCGPACATRPIRRLSGTVSWRPGPGRMSGRHRHCAAARSHPSRREDHNEADAGGGQGHLLEVLTAAPRGGQPLRPRPRGRPGYRTGGAASAGVKLSLTLPPSPSVRSSRPSRLRLNAAEAPSAGAAPACRASNQRRNSGMVPI